MSFRKLFGGPIAKILDHLLENPEADFSLTEIARYAGVSYRTAQREFPKLIELEFVRPTRRVGRAEMYQVNLANPKLKSLQVSIFEKTPEEEEHRVAYV